MSEPFLGEIRMFGGNFAPRNWAFCAGQLLSIAQNTALFSLLGTNYGGNGTTNFALPNLQGSAPIHQGQGAGLSVYDIGQVGGSPTVTLTVNEIPAHAHSAGAVSNASNVLTPTNNFPGAGGGRGTNHYAPPASAPGVFNRLAPAGGSQGHNNMQPFLAVSFIIALAGIFPARN